MADSGGAMEEFFVALGLSADGAAFASAKVMVDALEKGLEKLVEVAGEAFDKFAESIVQTAEYSHAVEHAAETTGLTTDSLQELSAVSRIAGTSADTMQLAYVHLAKTMAEARDGNEEAQKTFARLGTRVMDVYGKLRPVGAVMDDLSDGLARVGTGADQQALAMRALGKSGAETLSVFGKGAAQLQGMRDEVEQLGGVMPAEAIERGADFAKNMERLKIAGQGVVHEFAGPLLEVINPLLDKFIGWVKANKELIQLRVEYYAKILAAAFGAVAAAVEFAASNLDKFITVARVIEIALGSTLMAALLVNAAEVGLLILEYTALGVVAGVAAVEATLAWLAAAAPVLLIAAAIALVYLAFDDFIGFLEGKDSVIGDFVNEALRNFLNLYWELRRELLDSPFGLLVYQIQSAIELVGVLARELYNMSPMLQLLALALPSVQLPKMATGAIDALAPGVGTAIRYTTGDFTSGGATSPDAAARIGGGSSQQQNGEQPASVVHNYDINVQLTVNAAPGQSADEFGGSAAKQVRETVEELLREAASIKK